MEVKLRDVREWAKAKIRAGNEPPWTWYQYMKLIEAIDTILDGAAATAPIKLVHDAENIPVTMPFAIEDDDERA